MEYGRLESWKTRRNDCPKLGKDSTNLDTVRTLVPYHVHVKVPLVLCHESRLKQSIGQIFQLSIDDAVRCNRR